MSRIAVITGGTKGIGKAVYDLFSSRDYTAITCSRNSSNLRNHYICDVSDKEQVRKFADLVRKDFGMVDVLVNNAGGCAKKDYLFSEIPLDEWDSIINHNLNSVAYVTRLFLPLLKKRSSIVNISTSLTKTPMERKSLYTTSKIGLEALTRNLALELSKESIRVNCINPGPTDTDLLRGHFVKNGVLDKEAYQALNDSVPLGLTQPADIARAVYFLSSEDASMITGQVLSVDGGRSLKW